MSNVKYLQLNSESFNEKSLDNFVRHQVVKECLRSVDGEWKLMPVGFVEEWDAEKLRARARGISAKLGGEWYGYGAFVEADTVGFAVVSREKFGSRAQYEELVFLQVSEPYRGQGIGKELFRLVCMAAREDGAEKLYISAHSSKESQDAYRRLGCTFTEEINAKLAEEEPLDVQMEFAL